VKCPTEICSATDHVITNLLICYAHFVFVTKDSYILRQCIAGIAPYCYPSIRTDL